MTTTNKIPQVWSGLYFASIWKMKEVLPKAETDAGNMFRNFCAGVVGGTLGTMANTPFDVAVSRMRDVVPGDVQRYRWSLPSVAKIAAEEGVGALYKGFAAK